MSTVIENLKSFKILNTNLKQSVAASLELPIGDLSSESNQMVYILDAIMYNESDIEIDKIELVNNYLKKYEILGCGIRIFLKYSSFNVNSNIGISQLQAAVSLNKTSVILDYQLPGLGHEAHKPVLQGMKKGSTDLSGFEEKLKSIHSGLIQYINSNPEKISLESIPIYLGEKDENQFHFTQSMIYGVNSIIAGKSLLKAQEDTKYYDETMIKYIYNKVMPNKRSYEIPNERDKEMASNWKYLI